MSEIWWNEVFRENRGELEKDEKRIKWLKIVINELMDVEKGKREVRRESVMKNKEYKTVI